MNASRKIFTAFWGDGYPEPHQSQDFPNDWFTTDRGYTMNDIDTIHWLEVGETTDLSDLSGVHTVTRKQ